MFEPVEIQNILVATMAGALVVMFGALYALGFAMGKLNKQPGMLRAAYGAYAALSVSVFVLAYTLNLNGIWWGVTLTMLIGYLLAPQAIWKLSVKTHEFSD